MFITLHTLVWQGTEFAAFFLCPITDISATVAPIGVKFCTMVPDRSSPLMGHAVVDSNILAPSEVFSLSHRILTM